MRKKTFPARKSLSTLIRHTFRVEALEPRILLSADPVMGALQAILPDDRDRDGVPPGSYDIFNDPDYAESLPPVEANVAPIPVLEAASTVQTLPSAPPLYNVGIDNLAFDPDVQGQAQGFMDAVAVVVAAESAVGGGETIYLDSAELAKLQAGQSGDGPLIIGGEDSNAVIRIADTLATGESTPVVFNHDLVLMNPRSGGEIYIDSELTVGTLNIVGSGHTTIVSADSTALNGLFSIADSVEINSLINGEITFTSIAGIDGPGTLQIGTNASHSLDGNGDLTADTLALAAQSNIRIFGTVGGSDPLEGLSIGGVSGDDPNNVTFDGEVTLNGDLTIDATGTVIFQQALILNNGGSLTINGAAAVIFRAGVSLLGVDGGGNAGDLFIEADEIDFDGSNESVLGAGVITLRPFTLGQAIEIGSPPQSQTSGTLNIDIAEVQRLADGFSRIVIGHESGGHAVNGAGSVRLGAMNVEEQPTFRDDVEIYGGSIEVEDYNTPLYTLLTYADLKLDAVDDIELYNKIEANFGGTLMNIVLYSENGSISQIDAGGDGSASESIRAADLNVRASTGILLPFTELTTLTALNTGLTGDIDITETAAGGSITVTSISQSNAAGSGSVSLTTSSGDIVLAGSGVSVAGSGGVELTAGGSGDIEQNQDIASQGDTIQLSAAAAIVMADGTTTSSVSAAGDTGAVIYSAGTSITLSHIEADGSISLTALNGAITDGLTGDGANLDLDTALVTLNATTGIGTSAAPIQSLIAGIAARNTVSGGIYLVEQTALRITGDAGGGHAIELAGSNANLSIATLNGGITVEDTMTSTGASGAAGEIGNLLLAAVETAEGTAANIDVRADIASTSGSLTLLADDDILIDNQNVNGAPTLRTLASGQTLDLEADNAIVMEAAAMLVSNSGNQRLLASAGGIVLGQINTFDMTNSGSGGVSLAAGAEITDADVTDPQSVNVTAASVRFDAETGIGTGANALETTVATLAALSQTSGGVFLNESNGLTVGSIAAITVNRVANNSTTSAAGGSDGSLAGIASGLNGALVLTSGGDTLISNALSAAGSGHVRVDANGDLDVEAGIDAGSGHLSVHASGAQTYAAVGDLSTSGSGTIDVQADSIAMADGATTSAVNGNIRYLATQTLQIGSIATSADVSLSATSISDAGTSETDITADELRIVSSGTADGDGAGSSGNHLETSVAKVAADVNGTGAGGLYLTEADAIQIGTLNAINVNQVGNDGVTLSATADTAQSELASAAHLVLISTAGSMESLSGGEISAAGNLLLQAGGASSDITLGADVSNTGGDSSLNAGRDLLQNADIEASANGKTLDLQAGRHIVMADTTSTSSSNGNIQLQAGSDITLETLTAGSGNVSVSAGSDILDQDADGDSGIDISAAGLLLNAVSGIGTGVNHLETQVGTLTGNAGSDGLYLSEADGLTVDSLTLQINRVDGTAATTPTVNAEQDDLESSGHLVLISDSGDLTLSDEVSAFGSGNLLIRATTGAITQNNAIDGGSGHVSLSSGTSYSQKADIDTSGSGSIDLQAGSSIAMDDGTQISGSGNIRIVAGSTMTLGAISTSADVSLSATSISDAGTSETDITADELRIVSSGTADGDGAGSSGNHLETSVAKVAADVNGTGAGGLYLTEADAIQIGTLNAINVNQVGNDGVTLSATADTAQSELASAAHLVLISTAGSMESLSGGEISAAGNLLLQAGGASSDITLGADISNTGGDSSLNAGRDLLQNADIEASANGKTLDLQAGRHIVMADTTSTSSSNGNIQLQAGSDITLETLTAGSGNVSVSAGSDILDQDADGDSGIDISAAGLLLNAVSGIGTGVNHLETQVGTLTGNAGSDGLYLSEADGLTVDSLTLQINRVDGTATTTPTVNAEQDDLESSGHLVLISDSGDLTLSDEVSAFGSGNLLIRATTGAITQNNAIDGGSGHVSLSSGTSYSQKADIDTSGSGSIDLQAGSSIAMDDGTQISGSGNIRIVAGSTMTLGAISTSADVSLSATSISDAGTSETDITADELRIVTTGTADGNGAGASGNHLETSVAKVAADVNGTGAGGLYLTEADAIQIGTLNAINVNQVGNDGVTLSATADTAQSELASAAHLVLISTAGSMESLSGGEISAAGNLLLQAGGASSDITLGADISNTGGDSSLNAGRDLLQNADIEASANGKTLDLQAGRHIVMADTTSTSSSNGNIQLQAGSDITLETLTAGSGNVSVSAGSDILDQDADGDSGIDISAAGLLLNAVSGIGTGVNHLETQVGTLTGNAGSDGLYLSEADGLTVDSLTLQINRVDGTATTTPTVNAEQDDLESSGHLVLISDSGDLTLSDEVSAFGSGNLLIRATTGAITQNNAIDGGSGHVSLSSGTSYSQKADIDTSGSGSIDLQAGSSIAMDDGTQISGSGNIRIVAGSTMTLGAISTSADVSLSATSISDAGTSETDITADELRIVTTGTADGNGAGASGNHLETSVAKVAADVNGTGAGGLYLTEADAIQIGTLNAINVNQVGNDGVTLSATADTAQSELASAAHLVLISTAGSMESLSGGEISAAGNLLLQAGGASSDITLGADISNTGGDSSLNAGRDLLQNADIEASANGKTLDLQAGRHIVMADTSSTSTDAGNIRLAAGSSMTLGEVDARSAADRAVPQLNGQAAWGAVSLVAGAAILDNATEAVAGTVDLYAGNLRLLATTGAGEAANHLETEVLNFSADAGTAGLFVTESTAIVVTGVAAIGIARVDAQAAVATPDDQTDIDGAAGSEQSDLISDGALVLKTLAGNITLNEGDADSGTLAAQAAGNILMQAAGAGTDILLHADLVSSAGQISLNAARDIAQSADILATGSGKTIDLLAGRHIAMAQSGGESVSIGSNNGDIAVEAASGNITLETVSAGSGHVRLAALVGNILDGDVDGDSEVDVTAAGLQMFAGSSIGSAANHVETSVATLSAQAVAGSLYITESDAVSVETVAVSVQRVASDAGVALQTTSQADLTTGVDSGSSGNLVLVNLNGPITLLDGSVGAADQGASGIAVQAHGSGNILIAARDTNLLQVHDLTLHADVVSDSGHITLKAADTLELKENVSVATAAPGTISLQAVAGLLSMAGTANVTAAGSALRLWAAGNVALGNLAASNVSVGSSSGSISNAAGSSKNVTAGNLRLEAGSAIGTGTTPISTSVAVVSAVAGGGIYLAEDDDIRIDAVSVEVTEFAADAGTSSVTDAGADLVSGNNGNIVLVTTAGSITLEEGGDSDGHAVSASGSGNVLLQAQGAGEDVTAASDILSGSGHVTVLAADTVDFNTAGADIRTSAGGSIDVEAGAGSITQHDDSVFSAAADGFGSIRLLAANSVTLGGLETAANVSVRASAGSILDAGDTYLDIIAAGARLWAAVGIGTVGSGSDNAIETSIGNLSARATSGGINLLESDNLFINDVVVSVSKVAASGSATVTATSGNDAVQADVRTTAGNGSIVLRTLDGTLLLNAGSSDTADAGALAAHGSGNILLLAAESAGGTTANITFNSNADIASGSGHISLLAADSIILNSGVDIATSGSGSLDLWASSSGANISMNAASTLTSDSGSIRLLAANNVLLGDIASGSGSVSIIATAGSITDVDARPDSDNDITAVGLRLQAATNIGVLGASDNALEISVDTLSARAASGGMNLIEANGVRIDDVAVSVNRVAANATTGSVDSSDAAQSDLISTGGNGTIVLRATAGGIVLADGSAGSAGVAAQAHGSGNVLLQTLGDSAADIHAEADIVSTSGNVSVLAASGVSFGQDADIRTISTSASSGTIDVQAGTASIVMHASSLFTSSSGANGHVRLLADQSITLGDIVTLGKVSLTAGNGGIIDADALVGGANDSDTDISASALRMSAGTVIGTATNHLESSVATLSAQAANGGIYLLETDAITINDVGLSVNRVGEKGTTSTAASTDAVQADVRTTGGNGSIVLRTLNGGMTLNDGTAAGDNIAISAHGSGNVLLQAGETDVATDAFIRANADVLSTGGNISVLAVDGITFFNVGTLDAADIRTGSTSAANGSIDVASSAGAIIQQSRSVFATSGDSGNIRLHAATNVTVSRINSPTGGVDISAFGGNVIDADGTDDGSLDILSGELSLYASGFIGTGTNQIEIDAVLMSARADTAVVSSGIFLVESNDLTIGQTSAKSVNRVAADASTSTSSSAVAMQSDLISGGALVLVSNAGTLTLNEGDADAGTQSARAGGNILLRSIGTDSNLVLNADVVSSAGHISLNAGGSLQLNADVEAQTASRTLDLQAGNAIVIADGNWLRSNASAIRLAAGGDITLGQADARSAADRAGDLITNQSTWGSLSLFSASGAIFDNAVESLAGNIDVYAKELKINVASGGAGAEANQLETEVATLSALVGSGGLYLSEATHIGVSTTAVLTANVVKIDGTVTASTVSDAVQSDLIGGDNLVLATINGDITLNDGDGNGNVVSAQGDGNILLDANGALNVNAGVSAAGGHISLLASGTLTQAAAGDIATTGSGTIDVQANAINMADGASASSGSGNLRYAATTTLALGSLGTSGHVSLSGTAISDANADSLNVNANQLKLSATGTGTADNLIETSIATLSANVSSLYLSETDDLTLGDTTAQTVNRVQRNGTVNDQTDAQQSDLISSGEVVLNLGGNLSDQDSDGDTDTDLSASSLKLTAAGALGTGSNPLELSVDSLSASASALYLTEANALTIGTVQGQSGLTSAGNLILVSGGSLTGNSAVNAGGNLLLDVTGDLTANAAIETTGGHISLLASGTLTQAAAGDIATTGSGTIDVQANAINMADGASASSGSGNLRYAATTTLALGSLGTSGHVSLSGTAISDANADSLNVNANQLKLSATGTGTADNLIETSIATLSANVSSLYLSETDDLTLGDTTAQTVNRVQRNGTVNDQTDAQQSDLISSGEVVLNLGGNLSDQDSDGDTDTDLSASSLKLTAAGALGTGSNPLELSVDSLSASASALYLTEANALTIGTVQGQSGLTSAGNLILVSGGSLTGNSAVNAGGNLLLDVTGDLTANAAIETTGGHISLLASGTLTQAAAGDIATTGSGTIDVQANAINMADGASASSGSGNLRYAATTTLALGSLGTSGHVSLSGTAISDANADSLNVNANQLKLSATGTGTADNLIETSIASLSANVSSLYLSETDDLTLGDTAAQTVNRVQRNGTVNDQTDAQQSDLVSSGEVVLNLGGNLSDQDSDGDTDTDLSASSLKLTAAGALGTGSNPLELSVDSLSASASALYLTEANALTIGTVQGQSGLTSAGNLILVSGGSLTGNSAVNAGGNLLLDVTGDLTANAAIETTGGHISLLASGTLTQAAAGDIATTGSGTIDVQANAINMADGASASSGSGNLRYAATTTLALGSLGTSGHVSLSGTAISDANADSLNVNANHLRLTAVTGIGAADNSNAVEISVATLTAHATQGSISLLESDGLSIPNSNLTISVNRVERTGSTQALPAEASQVGLQASGQTWLNASSGLIELDQRIDAGPDQNVNLTGDSIEIQQPITGDGGVVNLQPTNPDLIIQVGGDTAGGGSLHLNPDSLNNLDGGFSQIVIGSDANPQIDLIGGTPAAPLVFEDPLVLDVNDASGEINLQGSTQAEAITADGPVVVQGPVDLGSTGNIVFEQSIDGQTGQTTNQLNLSAGGGDVTFAGEIGGANPLDGLDIANADDVTFDQAVTLNGDLVIEASGTVTFNGDLTLNGGTLTITGADAVVIGNVTFTAASGSDRIVIAADSLTLNGDIDGAGKLTLTPATASHDIHIGSTPVAGALNLSAADFAKLSSFDSLELISTDGDIAMQAGETVTVANAEVEIRAGGDIRLGTLNHPSGAFERVVLQSLDGRIVDANGSGAIDLTADEIVLRGLGVAEGGSGDVLEVDADRIVIDVDGGVVFQDVAADGTVRFMVMHEGVLYTQLINHGTATRGTDAVDPDGDDFVNLGGGAAAASVQSMFISSGAFTSLANSPIAMSALASKASYRMDVGGDNDLALLIGNQDVLAGEYGLDPYLLGEDILSAPVFSSGQNLEEEAAYTYWVEALTL